MSFICVELLPGTSTDKFVFNSLILNGTKFSFSDFVPLYLWVWNFLILRDKANVHLMNRLKLTLFVILILGAIKDYTVFDRIAMAWSASSNFVWSCGSKLLRTIRDVYLDDISYQIRERAKARYGLQVSVQLLYNIYLTFL